MEKHGGIKNKSFLEKMMCVFWYQVTVLKLLFACLRICVGLYNIHPSMEIYIYDSVDVSF